MQPSTSPARRLRQACALLVLVGLVGTANGQILPAEPWQGWHGPPGDGVFGLRFGMDRGTVDTILREGGLTQRHGRTGTLRYAGKISGVPAEIVLEFHDRSIHPRGLMGIRVDWIEDGGRLQRMVKLFQRYETRLAARYGEPVFAQEASDGQLSTSSGARVRLFRGTEMEARLDIQAPRPDTYYVYLRLKYPPIHPELAGQ